MYLFGSNQYGYGLLYCTSNIQAAHILMESNLMDCPAGETKSTVCFGDSVI